MCHESTSVALAEVIGIGKGSVSLDDIHRAELIVVIGQNPGTNHPRMLTALEIAKRNGAKILAINPLKEAGLRPLPQPAERPRGSAASAPSWPTCTCRSGSTATSRCSRRSARCSWSGAASTRTSSSEHTAGYDAVGGARARARLAAVERATGLDRALIEEAAGMFRDSAATVTCWAMGITQHRNAVATIKEITNVALLQGNIGKPGAGLCPVRGHSNVQGDRTMGIWERIAGPLPRRARRRSSASTRRASTASTRWRRSAPCARARPRSSSGMGGNFVAAAPDTDVTEDAMRRADLTVQVSTKLNRSHVVPARRR